MPDNNRNLCVFAQDEEKHFIRIKCQFDLNTSKHLYLSKWRPGRYEFGDFAKNIKNLRVFDSNNIEIQVFKKERNCWELINFNGGKVYIEYSYYSKDLNAGSTYSGETYFYVNPINCVLFNEEIHDRQWEIKLDIPENWKLAGVASKANPFLIENFDRLADTPFIASPNLVCLKYTVDDIHFSIWFNEQLSIPKDKLVNDFTKFTKRQLQDFRYFPSKNFEFLVITTDHFSYHGVEHLTSTMITLGPKYAVFNSLYTELLGVSSHELYHVWNVKAFRPKEMTPYNFGSENYSRFGYIYEGITTYLGDLYLLKSGVFYENQYFLELEKQIEKHALNEGRFHYSLGDSSIDTWIDGYQQGTPGRKVSIYTEGCLFALLLDIELIRLSDATKSISDFMQLMLRNKNHGYDLGMVLTLLNELVPNDWEAFFKNKIDFPCDFIPLLSTALNHIGISLLASPSKTRTEEWLAVKILNKEKNEISYVHKKGFGEHIGLQVGDKILSINGIELNADFDNWLSYFKEEEITLILQRGKNLLPISFKFTNGAYQQIPKYSLLLISSPEKNQTKYYNHWKK